MVIKGHKILAVAHSNEAVNNLANKMLRTFHDNDFRPIVICKWSVESDVQALMRVYLRSEPGKWRECEDEMWTSANSTAEWVLKALKYEAPASEDQAFMLFDLMEQFYRSRLYHEGEGVEDKTGCTKCYIQKLLTAASHFIQAWWPMLPHTLWRNGCNSAVA
ncbi:hypothetical protein SCUP515_01606 [Seiridium cupressi]